MAIVRCEDHPVKIKRNTHKYVNRAEPVGYEDTAAICGRFDKDKNKDCPNAGLVWLRKDEVELFKKEGKRVFRVHTSTVKIRVSDRELLPLP